MREKETVAAETNPYLQSRLKEAIQREQDTAKRIRLAQEAAEQRARREQQWRLLVTVGALAGLVHFVVVIATKIAESHPEIATHFLK